MRQNPLKPRDQAAASELKGHEPPHTSVFDSVEGMIGESMADPATVDA
jgi:hypothetical protein